MKIDKVVIAPISHVICLWPKRKETRISPVSRPGANKRINEDLYSSGIFFGDDCMKLEKGNDIDKKIQDAFYNRDIWASEWELKIPSIKTNEYTKALDNVIEILYYIMAKVDYNENVNFYFNNDSDTKSILSSEYFDKVIDIIKTLGTYNFNKIEIIDYNPYNYTEYEKERLLEFFSLKYLCTLSFTHDTHN